jgi:hypothetical protein
MIIIGYAVFAFIIIQQRGIFEYAGVDFRLQYATGMIIRQKGVAAIYDYATQSQYQLPLYQSFSVDTPASMDFWPLPLPYLAVFCAPMLMWSFFPPMPGFLVSCLINFLGPLVYGWFFLKRSGMRPKLIHYLYILASVPFFFNLIFGQVNLWLLVCAGEAYLAFQRQKPIQSGLWLAGLLLKPQLLLLLIPYFILKRQGRVLLGFLGGSVTVGFLSIALAGQAAITGPLNTIRSWPTVLGDSGMNLLTLKGNLDQSFPNILGTVIVISLTLITVFLSLYPWFKGGAFHQSISSPLLFASLLAAACTIAPHANIYMALPLIPFLLLSKENQGIPEWIRCIWFCLPSVSFLLLSGIHVGVAHTLMGTMLLIMNLFIVIWVYIDTTSVGNQLSNPSGDPTP